MTPGFSGPLTAATDIDNDNLSALANPRPDPNHSEEFVRNSNCRQEQCSENHLVRGEQQEIGRGIVKRKRFGAITALLVNSSQRGLKVQCLLEPEYGTSCLCTINEQLIVTSIVVAELLTSDRRVATIQNKVL